ncbi:GDSL-type esterase/lipase family protein [Cohnella pontilimi]|nr:GDSL-type esterase/lipase family protein [Cohnella pontilimi]
MKSTSWLWRGLGITSLVCTLLMMAGFGWALKDNWFPQAGMAVPKSAPPPSAAPGSLASKKELKIVAMGDSLTVGTGDATGSGYVKTAADGLSKTMHKPVRVLNNLALNGLRADQLLKLLDDKGYHNAIVQADIVFLTIGANDLFQIAQNGGSMAQGGDLSPEQLERRMPEVQTRLKDVWAKLRGMNPAARIVYVGLYNPFYDNPNMQPASDLLQEWNRFAHGLSVSDGNATVVPTYDLFESDIGRYLSSDHFHPNEAGYARIADRVVQALQ